MPTLTHNEVRVLGSLIEKQITTPEYYPLTLNALTLACNQKNNRNPVTGLTETEVEQAREEAYQRMERHARERGADAVIAVRYDATEFAPSVTEVLAYGTAVKLVKG